MKQVFFPVMILFLSCATTSAVRTAEDGVPQELRLPETAATDTDSASDESDTVPKRFQEAVQVLGNSTDPRELMDAATALASGFPSSRAVLVRCVREGNVQTRAFAVRTLGEKGNAEMDLATVAGALKDPDCRVRLTAVMALRKLGKLGFQPLADYLLTEKIANNRKMVIKTFQRWGEMAALPYLVHLLRTEQDPGVCNFGFAALESISGKEFGRDLEAWKACADEWLDQERAKLQRARAENRKKEDATP